MNGNVLVIVVNLSLYVLLGFIHAQARRNPGAPWVHWLYVRQFGPRMGTEHMRLTDCFRSAFAFLLWFAVFLGLWLFNAYTSPPAAEASAMRLGLNFVSGLFALLCLAGAGWVSALGLLVLLRRSSSDSK